jgi:hypothetical protein
MRAKYSVWHIADSRYAVVRRRDAYVCADHIPTLREALKAQRKLEESPDKPVRYGDPRVLVRQKDGSFEIARMD